MPNYESYQVIKEITLDLVAPGLAPVVNVPQYDTKGRVVKVNLVSNSAAYEIESDFEVHAVNNFPKLPVCIERILPAARLYSRLFSRRREVAPPLQISSADSARDVDAVFSLDVDTSRKLAVVAHTRLKQNVAVSVCVVYPDSRIGVAALYNHAVADRSVSSAAVNGDRPTRVGFCRVT